MKASASSGQRVVTASLKQACWGSSRASGERLCWTRRDLAPLNIVPTDCVRAWSKTRAFFGFVLGTSGQHTPTRVERERIGCTSLARSTRSPQDLVELAVCWQWGRGAGTGTKTKVTCSKCNQVTRVGRE